MNTKLIASLLEDPDVKLTAVTKKHTAEEVDELYKLGVRTFGENRVQEFLEKYNPAYDWHIIGHLQTNKVKYIIGKVSLIESVDSQKLAKEIEKQAAKAGLVQDVLVEVRVSRQDVNKTGTPLEEVDALVSLIDSLDHVRLKGFMTIASNSEDQDLIKSEFETARCIYEKYKKTHPDVDTLSMGMSHDYALAKQCGSTNVRVGTALFENPEQ